MRAKQRTAHASIVQESGVEDDDEEEEEEEDEEEDEDEDGEDGGSHGIGETFEGRERGHAKVEEAMETKSVSGKRSARLAKSLSRSLPSQSPLTNGGVPAAPMMATEDELATEDDNANYGEGSSSGRGRHVHADKSMIDNIEDDRDSANDSADDGANDMDDGRNSSDGEDEGESGGEETQMY